LARAIECCDPLAKVVKGQGNPLWVTDDYKGFTEQESLFATDSRGSPRITNATPANKRC
jgi:hypothetical protein